MQRPGLKSLLADIVAGLIDVIVVYKVEGLTRSLADFSKLVEVFDSNNVSFVSVTQAFNTTNSMGRLTLNVLLSFAQFEREVTGERIRDKIAMSRKRGLWTGGLPPLGYDALEKKLVVNTQEAEIVRYIYDRYTELRNVRKLRVDLTAKGYVSKCRTTKTGKVTGGKFFERGALYSILKNQTYLGLTLYKGEALEGEHEPIISKALFAKVQTILTSNRQRDKHKTGSYNPSLLAGKIITPNGITLTPSHAQNKGRRYRYYVERRRSKAGTNTENQVTYAVRPICLPAGEIERSVEASLVRFLSDPVRLIESLDVSDAPHETHQLLCASALKRAKLLRAKVLDSDAKIFLRNLVDRIELEAGAKGYRLSINIKTLADGLAFEIDKVLPDPIVHVPLKLKTCNNGKKVIISSARQQNPEPNAVLIGALRTAHTIKARFMGPEPEPISAIANELNMGLRQAWRTFKLAFLAPDIQLAILSGTQPRGLNLKDLIYQSIPISWTEQRRRYGFSK